VLDAIGGCCGLNVELKGGRTAELAAAKLRKRIDGGWAADRFILSASDSELLDAAAAADPDLRRGRVVDECSYEVIDEAVHAALYSIHPHHAELSAELVGYAQQRGLKVFAYTVNETADLERMVVLGIDGVFSDYPDRALAITARPGPSA
jgi:glycerophosphoryl diester phosphodiesterase